MATNYGMPWQGSKSKIAEWIVEKIPQSETLVDLFAGGCAITHCAMLSGKFKRIISNDYTGSPRVFIDAMSGMFSDYSHVPTRDEFFDSEDIAIKMLYSFGNDKTTYLWSSKLEPVKVEASKMLSARTLHERRMHYKKFCSALHAYVADMGIDGIGRRDGIPRLEGLERLDRLQGLERLDSSKIEVLPSSDDYRLVKIPDGATVYADPPYRGTPNSRRYGEFDFDAFDNWLESVNFPVFVSEFDCPRGCIEIARIERITSMAANSTQKRMERIFVQKRFREI